MCFDLVCKDYGASHLTLTGRILDDPTVFDFAKALKTREPVTGKHVGFECSWDFRYIIPIRLKRVLTVVEHISLYLVASSKDRCVGIKRKQFITNDDHILAHLTAEATEHFYHS